MSPVRDVAHIVNATPHTVKGPPSVDDDDDGNDQPPINAVNDVHPLSSLNGQELVPGPVVSLYGPSHLPAEQTADPSPQPAVRTQPPSPLGPVAQPQAVLCCSTCIQQPPEQYHNNNFILCVASLTYLLTPWSTNVQAAMHVDWQVTPKCHIARHFDDLQHQATCDLSNEILEIHPLSFHVRLNANDLDEPMYCKVSQSDKVELRCWQDGIDAELKALQEKCCFDIVNQEEAEGQQIVNSTWVFKQKRRPDGTLLKYKARLCI